MSADLRQYWKKSLVNTLLSMNFMSCLVLFNYLAWWKLREKYQGIYSYLPRNESHFDPGGIISKITSVTPLSAKYHVAANVPYARYFLAYVLQFQFHKGIQYSLFFGSCSLFF